MNIRINQNNDSYYFMIIYGAISIIFIMASRFFSPLTFGIKCIFKSIFKIPCPTCGTYRVLFNIAHFAFTDAFLNNPLIFISLLILLLIMLFSIITLSLRLTKYKISFSGNERKYLLLSILSLIISNWIYLIIAKI